MTTSLPRTSKHPMMNCIGHVAVALSFLLCACTTVKVPTEAEMASADYGAEPTQAQYEAAIHAYYAQTLKDPSSVQFREWTRPIKYWYGRGDSSTFGYLVCVSYNAKNAFGGYVGFKRDAFILRGPQLARVILGAYLTSDKTVC